MFCYALQFRQSYRPDIEVIEDEDDDNKEESDNAVLVSKTAKTADSLQSQLLLSELDEISRSQSFRANEVDLSEVPDLEEVDLKGLEREQRIFEAVLGSGVPANILDTDLELEGLDQ